MGVDVRADIAAGRGGGGGGGGVGGRIVAGAVAAGARAATARRDDRRCDADVEAHVGVLLFGVREGSCIASRGLSNHRRQSPRRNTTSRRRNPWDLRTA